MPTMNTMTHADLFILWYFNITVAFYILKSIRKRNIKSKLTVVWKKAYRETRVSLNDPLNGRWEMI